MRIAVTFPGCHRRAGVERVAFESARYLAGRGHEVTVFAGDWEVDLSQPIRYQRVQARQRPSFMWPNSFFRNCSKQVAGNYDALCSYGCACPTGGVYWVQSVHRAWLERSRAVRGRFSVKRMKQRLNPFHGAILKLERKHLGRRRYRKLIALTEEVKDDLIRWYDVPPQDVVIIPNGFSESEFNVHQRNLHREKTRSELGYNSDERVVIFVANELERKGFGPLVRAIASLKDPAIRLLAVGRLSVGAYSAEIAKLGLSSRVQFTGPTSDAARYYAAADVFALPTQYEAWGLVIVEAMACGLPVLTSKLAGAAMTVHPNSTGTLLEDPGDVEEIAAGLRSLLSGKHASPDAISASVNGYAWNQILSKYERILLETAA